MDGYKKHKTEKSKTSELADAVFESFLAINHVLTMLLFISLKSLQLPKSMRNLAIYRTKTLVHHSCHSNSLSVRYRTYG